MIEAECHSDDNVIKVDFDATPWFAQATSDEISKLAKIDWGGNYESDAVADYCEDINPRIGVMHDHIRHMRDSGAKSVEDLGWYCSIDEDDAMRWLKANRADDFNRVCRERSLNPSDYEGEPAPSV